MSPDPQPRPVDQVLAMLAQAGRWQVDRYAQEIAQQALDLEAQISAYRPEVVPTAPFQVRGVLRQEL